MISKPELEAQILTSWHRNAAPWSRAVRNQEIRSRSLVTDQAIVEAVLSCHPRSLLDVGCGEGWLSRALSQQGLTVLGVDAVPALIEQAKALGSGTFQTIDYAAIAAGELQGQFDAIACNFSLLGDDSVESLLKALPALLTPTGSLIIQTLHPQLVSGSADYIDGWREGSWAGFTDDFTDPAPWYFRTVESWLTLLQRCGFEQPVVSTPRYSDTQQLASLILMASKSEGQ